MRLSTKKYRTTKSKIVDDSNALFFFFFVWVSHDVELTKNAVDFVVNNDSVFGEYQKRQKNAYAHTSAFDQSEEKTKAKKKERKTERTTATKYINRLIDVNATIKYRNVNRSSILSLFDYFFVLSFGVHFRHHFLTNQRILRRQVSALRKCYLLKLNFERSTIQSENRTKKINKILKITKENKSQKRPLPSEQQSNTSKERQIETRSDKCLTVFFSRREQIDILSPTLSMHSRNLVKRAEKERNCNSKNVSTNENHNRKCSNGKS